MRNLVSNAVKYTKQGGLIEISVEIGKDEDTITIADNGVGIKPENIEKLWTIAQKYTTKGTANESGSGLGLILCKEFIEKHGGKIWVETAFGFGSKFKFTLPKGNQ
jgi:signal transduction histidine kinase